MLCQQCKKENRATARFCKWCGNPVVSVTDPLDKIVGRDSLKQQIRQTVETYSRLRTSAHTHNIWLNINTIIVGDTGTGKTFLPEVLRDYLFFHKIIEKPKLQVVDAVDYERFIENWDSNIKKARGGILFFDNVQKLLPDSYSKNVNPLDKLFIEMDHWNNDPIVILSGLPGGFDEFLENNPSVKNRFKYLFRLPAFTPNEVYSLCLDMLKERYGIHSISAPASEKLLRQIKYEMKSKDDSFGNAHHARQKAEDIFTAYISHPSVVEGEIQEMDICGYVPPIRTLEQILTDLDEFVGMDMVKQAIREIAWEMQGNLQRAERGLGDGEKPSIHIVLTGNPGTGKTSIARKLGEIFESIGFLDSGHVVEVDRSQMVSQYMGETPKLVDKLCDRAMGGILFVDEAYTLAPVNESGSKDEQGLQALEKLMKRMEDDRGKFVVVVAGYKNEMEHLLRVNPGMRSRFNRFLHIDDYTPDELFLILKGFVRKKNYRLSSSAEERVWLSVKQMYESRDNHFANGREIRSLFEKMCTRHAERMNRLPMERQTNEELQTFQAEDIPFEKANTLDCSEALKDLNDLVGLQSVKDEITEITSFLTMQAQRGVSVSSLGKHYVFTGNPGTGKTTVARIMANIFRSLGCVSRGQLIEADRSSLVAGYAGQTAIKTNQLIDSALGGVLFIDEAYTLCSGENDSFGKEALDTLLKRLEDDRGKFVCIVAGYTREMHAFIDSNPGLKSRFTQTIHFEDYSPTELTKIFLGMVGRNKFHLTGRCEEVLLHRFENIYAMRDKNFGNAREARKLFDQSIANQSKRLMELMNTSEYHSEMMFELKEEDILGKEETKVKTLDEVMVELDEFVGMKSVKEAVRRLAVQIVFMQQRLQLGIGVAEPLVLNMLLTGNPGTGKTSVARKMGEVFKAVGLLPTSKVIEVDRSQMIGKYMGETPKLVNALCDRAMGGILFIDEAYTLYDTENGNDNYGKEAVETLMKRMEDDKGKFVVIAAGYRKEMEAFMQVNPGLESRFTYKLNIEDYTEHELVEIFCTLVKKKQYRLSESAEIALVERVHELYSHKDRNFGNAREMRTLFERTIQQLSIRVSSIPPSLLTENDYQLIEAEDIRSLS